MVTELKILNLAFRPLSDEDNGEVELDETSDDDTLLPDDEDLEEEEEAGGEAFGSGVAE